MKPHYFICFEGGSSGNFIGLLIRSLAKPEFLDSRPVVISSHGSCDVAGSGGYLSHQYAPAVLGHVIYPESEESLAVILSAIADPDNTYKKESRPWIDHFDFTAIHYTSSRAINLFLKNQHVYVILITMTEEDLDLIAVNAIYKNVEPERNKPEDMFNYIKKTMTTNGIDGMDTLEQVEKLHDLPDSLVHDLIIAQKKMLLNTVRAPDYVNVNNMSHDRLFKLPFNLIYSDQEKTLKMISDFTKLEINESARQLYKDYMSAQQPILSQFKL